MSTQGTPTDLSDDPFAGGGEMGARMRATDWSRTAVGPVASWPQSLKTIVRVMLTSRYAMWMGWGADLTFFYNDAYRPTLGVKHQWALGAPTARVWKEIWPDIGPRAEAVLRTGVATWDEGLQLFLERSGYAEETYHTFSYSPVPDDDGTVGGMLCVVTEDTERTIGDRRLGLLRELASDLPTTHSEGELFAKVAQRIGSRCHDLPFTLVYLFDPATGDAELACSAGARAGSTLAPARIQRDAVAGRWPAADVQRGATRIVIDALPAEGDDLPETVWGKPPQKAVVVPIAEQGRDAPAGFLVAGLNPFRPFDAAYSGFVDLVAGQVAAGLANVRAHAAERRRAEALAELDRAKTAFFSNVSHEFRTPLTLMLGPLEDALDAATEPSARERLQVAHRNSLRLLKLVNTLLDFARIEAGRVQATYEPVDVAELTTELASVFRSAIERAGLRFTVDCARVAAPVFVDREMWEKIVANLLSNAFKYTLGGEIAVTLRARDDRIELAIRDSGIGIPAHELPHVFDRFHRVAGAQGRTHEGTGIGLALVHELVKLHGGSVGVESALGRGTTFTVTIPTGSAHLPADRVGALRTLASTALGAAPYVEEAMRWLPDTGGDDVPAELLAVPEKTPARVSTPGARIVVADDNADMRDYLRRLLGRHWSVDAVADGEAAFAAVTRERPDLVLTDVMMPRLDGFGLLKAIRADPQVRTLPVILLSARAGEESRVEGLDAGADDYLIKPFSARELLARVSAHLEMARIRRQANEDLARSEAIARASALALGASEERLTIALEVGQVGTWDMDLDTGETVWSASYFSMLGLDPAADLPSMGTWTAMLHPEDRERALAEYERASRDRDDLRQEYRIIRRDGAERWFAARGRFFYDDAGCARRMLGALVDVTDAKRAADALRASEQALADANARKDEFLAMLAHELRNPLAPIKNATRLLTLLGTDQARAVHARDIIRRQTEHLSRLVDDLLDVSRITRGKIALQFEPVVIESAVEAAVEMVRPSVDRLQHTLTTSLPKEPVRVQGDFARLVQVIANLITNAAKFTPSRGRLALTVQQIEDEAIIRVRDSGIGIDPALQPRIFDLFVQDDVGLARTQGGLGIGLTLVKRIVELHRGRVAVTSEGRGRGSEFVVHLPALPQEPTRRTAEPTATLAAGGSRLRILLVEDNPDAADSFTMLLELGGHEVRTAQDGPAALEIVEDFCPDLAFVDVGLPGMDGYELAMRLRAHPRCRVSVLIALTGYGREEDKRRAVEAGFDHHLTKPVDYEAVDRLLASASRPIRPSDADGRGAVQ
jgi:PAS domain S-box-containing protein